MTFPDHMSMSFGTMLRMNDRSSLMGMFCEPKGETQRGCRVGKNLSPPSAYCSLCGKVNTAYTKMFIAISTDVPRSYGCSHPVPR